MRFDELVIPDSRICRSALEVATVYCSPALLNHSVRAYLWAAAYAGLNDLAFDAELLYVSSMLHDLGLTDAFDNHGLPFEEAGGHVAWVFGAGAGWPVERRGRAAEVIVKHMWDEVPLAEDPEGHLLELSTGLDISGRNIEAIPAELRAEVLARHPRGDLAAEFVACFESQAARKPGSLAGDFVRTGFGARVAANPLDA